MSLIRFTRLPIHVQLIILSIILMLPALGIIVYSGVEERNEDYRRAAVESQKLADNLAVELESLIQQAQQLGILLAELPDVRNRNVGQVQKILTNTYKINPQYQNILIADKTGDIWVSAKPSSIKQNVADRRYFKSARATLQFSSGEFVLNKVTHLPTIAVAYPLVTKNMEFDGVIIMSFDLDALRSILRRAQLPKHTNYILVDHKGIIISRGSESGQIVGKPIQAADLKKMEEGPDKLTYEFVRMDGDRRITTYRKLRLPGEQSPYMYVRAGLSSKEALANANRALIYNIAMLLPFVAVAFVLAFVGGKRSIVDRIAKLKNAAKSFADGNLETRVAGQVEGGELGELARAFDDMASRVSTDIARRQAAEDEVRTLNADLETRVNARTAELKKLNSELETFCYSISHELRGPIARLEGFSAVIQDLVSDPDPESLAHIARRIEVSSSKLKIVVDSLLEMNRISRTELKREDVLLSEMCRRISAELCEHSERDNLKVTIEPDMVVKGDSTMLEVCMQNLLGNAVKYTAMTPEAAIEVGQLTRQGETVYYVKDNGAGFDMEYSNKLFQPFCRLHAENEFEGFGIGLATVERIIDKHGGRIWAESTVGHGATFYFTLG